MNRAGKITNSGKLNFARMNTPYDGVLLKVKD